MLQSELEMFNYCKQTGPKCGKQNWNLSIIASKLENVGKNIASKIEIDGLLQANWKTGKIIGKNVASKTGICQLSQANRQLEK